MGLQRRALPLQLEDGDAPVGYGALMMDARTCILKNPQVAALIVLAFLVSCFFLLQGGTASCAIMTTDHAMQQPKDADEETTPHHCQIIYVVGIEGSQHHGTTEVITKFASRQIDENGEPFQVKGRESIRDIVNWHHLTGQVDVVPYEKRQETMDQLCPNDGRRHVLIEDNSFPSGYDRRSEWKMMTPQEIAAQLHEDPHPVDLLEFANQFSPFAQIRFVVLHRPYINTVVSRIKFDKTTDVHAHVVSGNLIYLESILRHQPSESVPPFIVLCVSQLSESESNNQQQGEKTPRGKNLKNLANLMQWPQTDCPECFDEWRDSKKVPMDEVSLEDYQFLLDEREKLKDIWPPVPDEDKADCPL